ncbi:MAG: hypothetical protein NPIRA04_30460 [Nitrospirales bacterium]|nr:MAG: hypothetical protein NPIRA04_30460 [Nitrospirales bacterium]
MAKAKDFVYSTPPLVEVISEVRWETTPVEAIPGASIDPHFLVFNKKFSDRLKKTGFEHVQRVVPDGVPIELTSGNPIFRFRKAKNAWPLYQSGPGLFTANIVPPYKGWKEFKKFLDEGLTHLYSSYPLPNEYLRIKRLELRYMDAFQAKHGAIKRYPEFLEEHLGIVLRLPNLSDKEAMAASLIGDIHIPLPNIDNSLGIISLKTGQITKNDKKTEAIIMELIIRKNEFSPQFNKRNIVSWFNKGHSLLHKWFDQVCSDELKATFGEKRELSS